MRITPTVRISIGLVAFTISLLLFAKVLGLAPDQTEETLRSRQNVAESLAMQLSYDASSGKFANIKNTLTELTDRSKDIRSIALRNSKGDLLVESGNHLQYWHPGKDGKSTIEHIQVPIFRGQKQWATVEISFTPVNPNSFSVGSYLSLILFIAVCGFFGYFFMMRRTLRELDPTTVIPQRVQAAFDVLKEGVLILDEKEHIVLANKSFAKIINKDVSQLIGLKGSELNWKGYKNPETHSQLPWINVLAQNKRFLGFRLILEGAAQQQTTFMVNAAPVLDNRGACRGVLVTFDDVTELEEKNIELSEAVSQLQVTTKEIQHKNEELEFLATHDPLTQLLNRRALGTAFSKAFDKAQQKGRELSCIMCDIDHFKSVNDRYGHATGDIVIKSMASILKNNSREQDLVGRYGGEEFCLVMIDLSIEQAAKIAERMRQTIKEDMSTGVAFTASFGVSSLQYKAHEPDELSNQADKALYVAKESGRNRVVCWGGDEASYLAGQPEKVAEQLQKQDTVSPVPDEVNTLNIRVHELEELVEKRSLELKHQNAYDALTGLPTRMLFHDRIQQALLRGNRYDHIVAVLSMSIQTIQQIHDLLGHNTGEQLLGETAKRMSSTLRSVDTVSILSSGDSVPTLARLGQEDFGILLVGIDRVDAVTWIVKRILDAFSTPFTIEGKEIFAKSNIGISIYPFDGETPDELEKNAAIAKRHAQNNLGENRYYFYSNKLNASSRKHLELESQLHHALQKEELFLHYQPKILAATGKINGVEALIRWNNPDIGPVPPFEFIPIAEYSGLIIPIGEWVLNTACRQTRKWIDMGFTECSIAVNFSAKQFHDEHLPEKIRATLEKHQLPPKYLTVEVTESLMMENIQTSLHMLKKIHGLGVNIALDDFGTGYSSLSYLKNFPLTHVKIDRSFVADIENNKKDAVMVESIINMAHSIDLMVTAEGVENQNQVRLLEQYGCDEMQGFLFSKPLSADEITKLLQSDRQYNKN